MKQTITFVAVLFVAIYLLMGFLLYFMQRQLIYMPTPTVNYSSANRIIVESAGERIKVWEINSGKRHAIIYFGGNAEEVGANITDFKNYLSDYTVFLVNYRGYSGSSGTPTEEDIYVDALKVYEFIKQQFSTVSIIGRSLGGGVATYLAVNRDIDNLVLVSPFDSIESIAQDIYPLYPISMMLKDKYDSYSRAHLIKAKTLVIVAENDEIIPRKNADRLIKGLSESNTIIKIISGATHNTIDNDGEYLQSLSKFFGRVH